MGVKKKNISTNGRVGTQLSAMLQEKEKEKEKVLLFARIVYHLLATLCHAPRNKAFLITPVRSPQTRTTVPPITTHFQSMPPRCWVVSISTSSSLSSSPDAMSKGTVSSSAEIFVVILAINALRDSGASNFLTCWYDRKPECNFFTVPHIPWRTPNFATSLGIPMSS